MTSDVRPVFDRETGVFKLVRQDGTAVIEMSALAAVRIADFIEREYYQWVLQRTRDQGIPERSTKDIADISKFSSH